MAGSKNPTTLVVWSVKPGEPEALNYTTVEDAAEPAINIEPEQSEPVSDTINAADGSEVKIEITCTYDAEKTKGILESKKARIDELAEKTILGEFGNR